MVLISNRELLVTASKTGPSPDRTCKLTFTTGWTHWLKTMKTWANMIQWRSRCTPRFLLRSRWRRTISSVIKGTRMNCRQILFIKMAASKNQMRTWTTITNRLLEERCENSNNSALRISSNWKTSRYRYNNSSLIELLLLLPPLQLILNLALKVKRLKLRRFRRTKTCVTAT